MPDSSGPVEPGHPFEPDIHLHATPRTTPREQSAALENYRLGVELNRELPSEVRYVHTAPDCQAENISRDSNLIQRVGHYLTKPVEDWTITIHCSGCNRAEPMNHFSILESDPQDA